MATLDTGTATERLRTARDFLLTQREDYETAYRDFALAAARRVQLGARLVRRGRGRRRGEPGAVDRRAGRPRGRAPTPSSRSAPTRSPTGCATWAWRRGDRIIVMLGNQIELWETILAAMKLGAVIIPATPLLGPGRPASTASSAATPATSSSPPPTPPSSTTCPATTRASRSAIRSPAGTPTPICRRPERLRPRRPDQRRRPAAPLLHLGHDRPAEARRAHARLLSGRAPVDDVLDRPAARRRPPQRLLAGLGQARVEQRLRAVERRGLRDGVQLRPLRRAGAARPDGPLRGDDVLRAADRVADAHPGGPRRAGSCRCARRSPPASRSTPR